MSDRNLRFDYWFGVGAAIALTAFLVCGWLTYRQYQREHRYEREHPAHYQIAHGAQQGESLCVTLPHNRATACVTKTPEAKEPDTYAREDLKAQQDMAEWTFATLLVSLAGVGTTVIGLVYIVRAYNLNADATEHAARAANAATRSADAYTSAERPHLLPGNPTLQGVDLSPFARIEIQQAAIDVLAAGMRHSNRESRPKVEVVLTNYGKSPAIMRRIWARLYLGDLPETPVYAVTPDVASSLIVPPDGKHIICAMLENNRILSEAEVESAAALDGAHIVMVFRVEYEDVFGVAHIIRQAIRYIPEYLGSGNKGYWATVPNLAYWEYS